MSDLIVCRAKLSKSCYDGQPVESVYGEGGKMSDDGTYDYRTNSVVCDACYIAGGQPSIHVRENPSSRDVVDHVNRKMGIE